MFTALVGNVVKRGDDYVAVAQRGKIQQGYQNESVEIVSEIGECEFRFSKNKEYTVHAYVDRNGELRTDACSDTSILENNGGMLSPSKSEKGDTSRSSLPVIVEIITIAGALAMLVNKK